ncbi:uncharacterized protein LOC122010607 [Zingiber officinale]|uniref:uncharacterized protein LOC122010607 n=1 Tax=Zingiber officinale TaxID=94328 RepID=UPI001C4ADAA4|nr:uncharacterized protein LOC122010607 [Zingiber officinale]
MIIKFIWYNIVLVRYPSSAHLRQWEAVHWTEAQGGYEGYNIQQVFTSVVYLQSNGQVEVTNREILRGLRAQLDQVRGSWVDELPSVLWVLRTTLKEVTDIIPFQLVCDGEVVVPIEVGVESNQGQLYDEGNVERRLMELDLVDEARDKATVRLTAYR